MFHCKALNFQVHNRISHSMRFIWNREDRTE